MSRMIVLEDELRRLFQMLRLRESAEISEEESVEPDCALDAETHESVDGDEDEAPFDDARIKRIMEKVRTRISSDLSEASDAEVARFTDPPCVAASESSLENMSVKRLTEDVTDESCGTSPQHAPARNPQTGSISRSRNMRRDSLDDIRALITRLRGIDPIVLDSVRMHLPESGRRLLCGLIDSWIPDSDLPDTLVRLFERECERPGLTVAKAFASYEWAVAAVAAHVVLVRTAELAKQLVSRQRSGNRDDSTPANLFDALAEADCMQDQGQFEAIVRREAVCRLEGISDADAAKLTQAVHNSVYVFKSLAETTMCDYLRALESGSLAAQAWGCRGLCNVLAAAAKRFGQDPLSAEEVATDLAAKLATNHGARMAILCADKPQAYFLQVLRNALVDHHRARRRMAPLSETLTEGLVEPTTPIEDIDWADVVSTAMARLSPQERDLLTLRFWEGRSIDEIADHIGIDYFAAAQRLSRLCAKLRDALQVDFRDSPSSPERDGRPRARS